MTTQLDTRLAALTTPAPTLFRVVFGQLIHFRGTIKLFGLPSGQAIPVGTWPLWYAGLLEFVLGALITRIAAFVVSGEMAVAYFWCGSSSYRPGPTPWQTARKHRVTPDSRWVSPA